MSNCDLRQIVGNEREGMLFENIIKYTNRVAIGPLEYCGNALAFNKPGGHGKMYVTHILYIFPSSHIALVPVHAKTTLAFLDTMPNDKYDRSSDKSTLIYSKARRP
jgi:hypothetical protein